MSKNVIPRAEYPRPQFVRKDWVNLNGTWTYEFDFSNSALERGCQNSKGFVNKIIVPFCPESSLSSVGYKDFIPQMMYHRKIAVPAAWKGKRIFLNFGAVDFICEGYVDGNKVGRHVGGSSSFSFDLTDFVSAGKTHDFVLLVHDDVRSGEQPGGKQSRVLKKPFEAFFDRVTGIWQTVWMECVSEGALARCRIVPDFNGGALVFTPEYLSGKNDRTFKVTVYAGKKIVGKGSAPAVNNGMSVYVPLSVRREWSPDDPFLYDVRYEVVDKKGKVIDSVKSYAGLREIHTEGNRIFLNGKEIFLRLVLDQGMYPDGIWTAPSDEALKRDVEISLAAGFNGARLHQKVFEERFHYWADKLGYLTWAESPSWGLDFGDLSGTPDTISYWKGIFNFKKEWSDVVMRDVNHPSIITWTPLNEAFYMCRHHFDPPIKEGFDVYRAVVTSIYDDTKALDPTRLVNDASGWHHIKTDLWTVHCYKQTVEEMKEYMFPADFPVGHTKPWEEGYHGQPYLNDEFGVGYLRRDAKTGKRYPDKEHFYTSLRKLVSFFESDKRISGFCFCELYNVEHEIGTPYGADRSPNVDIKKLCKIIRGNGR